MSEKMKEYKKRLMDSLDERTTLAKQKEMAKKLVGHLGDRE